jgi:flagellar biogenesis protein FliO
MGKNEKKLVVIVLSLFTFIAIIGAVVWWELSRVGSNNDSGFLD